MNGGRGSSVSQDNPKNGLVERVADFSFRCGRVLAIPCANDMDLLSKVHNMQLVQTETTIELWRWLPPHIELDALAARARPLILRSDRCSYERGLSALRRLVLKSANVHANGYADSISDLKAGWVDHISGTVTRELMAEQPVNGSKPVRSYRDREMADMWLYGDLVHADEGRIVGTQISRAVAGWAFFAQVIELCRLSVQWVRALEDELQLGIPDWAFETQDLPSGRVLISNTIQYIGAAPSNDDRDITKLTERLGERPPGFKSPALKPGESITLRTLP